jgi:ACR3 family arsenite transporter
MFFLAIACLPQNNIPYIRGLIFVGLARCIAMVIVWNDLASGSPEYAAILVCLNSMFQIVCYSPYAYFFVSVLLPLFQLSSSSSGRAVNISFALVVESVAIYLGIPFAIGLSSWLIFNKLLTWKKWYKEVFVPRTAPLTLIALLFTIIVMFILKGHLIVSIPLQVVRVAIPLCIYFTTMFVGVYYCCFKFGFTLEQTITLAFTSASNNFELAIAVSIAVFGLDSPEAFVGVIGPLVEVPVMLGFVHLVKVLHRWWPTESISSNQAEDSHMPEDLEATFPSIEKMGKNVLFLCTGNSCRSHMAQAWCWYYHSTSLNLKAYSAGTAPVPGNPGSINPYAMKAMMEFGIDLTQHRSKNVIDLEDVDFHLVLTVCDDAAQNCPMFKSKNSTRVVHHSFDDPPRLVGSNIDVTAEEEEEIMLTYRRVSEEIRVFIRDELPCLLL